MPFIDIGALSFACRLVLLSFLTYNLRRQLTVKDEQIATANRIADQAQQLDLTTHKQTQPDLPQKVTAKSANEEKHGWLWRITH
ncbi:DUF536 domain-containing protein [Limosilactobacillus fermentum]|uniref:DUF536 domain-containing protein n=1 Tax=Limosilactobacillus fermentum TaxID=1613 RepID=UPI003DA501AD